MTSQTEVHIAGVPWPRYKVVSLAVFGSVFLMVGGLTLSATAAVLSAAAAATVVWIAFGASTREPHRPTAHSRTVAPPSAVNRVRPTTGARRPVR